MNLAGISTCTLSRSYFSAVTASTRLFKSKPGLAIAGPLTLFSLSSLFLTSLGTYLFTSSETGELDASAFLSFLGILCGSANILSAICMAVPSAGDGQSEPTISTQDERTPLIREEADEEGRDPNTTRIPGVPDSQSVVAFLMCPSVWALALLMVVGVGAAEMVLGSVSNHATDTVKRSR